VIIGQVAHRRSDNVRRTHDPLSVAVQHHQNGELAKAERICRQVLSTNPSDVDALHLLGMIAHQAGKHTEAVVLIGKAISLDLSEATMHYHLGLAQHALHRLDEAVASYRQAIALRQNHAGALTNWLWHWRLRIGWTRPQRRF
jgi:Flp pilus assembly protein TadD